MVCREVKDNDGNVFLLTIEEEKYVRAIERLEKMDAGRIRLFGSGRLNVRINGIYYRNEIFGTEIQCEGGDGGDNE